jgi:RHS repeat-associated protein
MISAITSANSPTTNKTYAFDNNYNITAINDPVTPSLNATATYDLNNRVATYSYNSNSHSYNFNTSSDLTSKIDNTVTTTFNYASISHQLNSLSGGQTDSISTDANGNVTSFGGNTLTYDAKNRLNTLNNGTLTTNYSVNYLGERTEKSNTNNTSYFMYDTSGALVGDYDSSGNTQDEYIYLNGNVVGLIQNGNLYYVYDDHLGTPRAITDTSNNLQWTWENAESFGNNQPTSVVSDFTFNLRFPGQYFDNESNLSYNLHRDYNPNWGRYIESDPIGLAGGLNTYTYVDGNTLSHFDYSGLDVWIEGPSGSEPRPHLSVSVGNPWPDAQGNYNYVSASFGVLVRSVVDNHYCTLGCVYKDDSLGGPILHYIKTTPEQDTEIIKYIQSLAKDEDKNYYVIDNVCIGYTNRTFNKIKEKFNLHETKPNPKIPVAPWIDPLFGPSVTGLYLIGFGVLIL